MCISTLWQYYKEIVLTCAALTYSIGAEILHIMENGKENPIAYASHTLTAAEKINKDWQQFMV